MHALILLETAADDDPQAAPSASAAGRSGHSAGAQPARDARGVDVSAAI
jgi:hypothetical protein